VDDPTQLVALPGFRSGSRSRSSATCSPASGCGPLQPRRPIPRSKGRSGRASRDPNARDPRHSAGHDNPHEPCQSEYRPSQTCGAHAAGPGGAR